MVYAPAFWLVNTKVSQEDGLARFATSGDAPSLSADTNSPDATSCNEYPPLMLPMRNVIATVAVLAVATSDVSLAVVMKRLAETE